MIQNGIKELRQLFIISLDTKHVKIYTDGRMTIKFFYKANVMPADAKQMLEKQKAVQSIVEAITGSKYKSTMTIEPVANYRFYMHALNSDINEATRRKINEKIRYFTKTGRGRWTRAYCQSIEIKLFPLSPGAFREFISKWGTCVTTSRE